jgi:cytochrome c biogenesis protein CcmG, thiol:disulfide interchange protein DsbE
VLYIGVMLRALAIVTMFMLLGCALAHAQEAAPNLDLRDLKGAPHKLEEYRGKPVVLNFWATWCVPCAAEMPLLNEMQKRYQDKVLFVAASIDEDDMKPQIEAFIKKHQGDALTVMMGATLDSLDDFGVNQGMPGTVFIDAEGNIVDRLSGALKRTDLQQRLRKLTGEPEPTPTPQTVKKKPSKSSPQKVVPAAQERSRPAF